MTHQIMGITYYVLVVKIRQYINGKSCLLILSNESIDMSSGVGITSLKKATGRLNETRV